MKEDITYRTFVRFGKLGLVKQKGFGTVSFHAPPATKGFYAMPIKFQEYYLISGIGQTQPNQLNVATEEKFKDPDTGETDWEGYSKKERERYRAVRHEFIIKKDTEFWHHLDVPNNEVLDRHNEWVKTSYNAWKKALNKENIRLRAVSGGDKGVNSTKKRAANFTRDHFEVFFDSKVA